MRRRDWRRTVIVEGLCVAVADGRRRRCGRGQRRHRGGRELRLRRRPPPSRGRRRRRRAAATSRKIPDVV